MSKKSSQPYFPPPQLPKTGVESHAHLDSRHFKDDLEDVLARAYSAGVERIGQVFLHPNAWREGRGLFDAHPGVFFLLGIHPTEAHDYNEKVRDDIKKAVAEDSRIRAIGEIGLDYYWKDCPPDVQKPVFAAQLELCRECDLPAVIHCRDATNDTLKMLIDMGMRDYPVLWHCFGGDKELALQIVDLGWHLSIPGPVTYPANSALREAVAAVPLERLLVETDCPYLSPVPLRGKRNEPANLGYTIAAMAEARGLSAEEMWTQCGNNAKFFFKLF